MSARASLLLLPIIYLGFISLGLPDGTLGVAWPRMHPSLELPIGLAGTLLFVGTVFSGISSYSSGRIIARFKVGPVVLVSCLLTGSGLMLLSQAQGAGWLFLAAVPLGFGAGAVDAGLNGYVARHYSGRHMNWLHACWGIGATCGPLIMTRALLGEGGWRSGFFVIGSVQLALAVVFVFTLRMWDRVPERTEPASGGDGHGPAPTMRANSAAGYLSALVFAFYVAVEATTGLWASTILVTAKGVDAATAGLCATAYYGSITAGRVLVGFVVDRWGNRRLVTIGVVLALAGAVLFALADSVGLAALALVMLGFGFAPVYPCMMHEVPRRFALQDALVVIGRQSSASYVGGALVPAAAGWLAQQVSVAAIPWAVVVGIIAMALAIRRVNQLT